MKNYKVINIVFLAVVIIVFSILVTLLVIQSKENENDDSFIVEENQSNETEKEDKRTDSQKYYDNKCQSYITQNVNLAKGQIVFIGDSITDLYILDDHYADLPLACYNRGIGGDTTEGVLRRLKISVFDIKPSKIVLMIGTNDINGGSSENKILETYAKIIDKIYAELPDVELYCVSIIPQNSDIESYSSVKLSKSTAKILSINPNIRLLAEEKGATYVDLFPLLADENNHLIKEYSNDGLHLNEKGLSVWTKLMKSYFSEE